MISLFRCLVKNVIENHILKTSIETLLIRRDKTAATVVV